MKTLLFITVLILTSCTNVDVLEKNTQSHQNQNDGLLGKNLLKNASFENEFLDWHVPLGVSWSDNEGVNSSGVVVIQADIPPEDRFTHETKMWQCVLLPNGEKFQLKGEFKTEEVLSDKYAENAPFVNRVNVIWYESKNCASGGQYGWFIEPKNIYGWQSLKSVHLKPAFKAIAAKITIVQRGRYARGYKGYWDNISFAVSEVFQPSSQVVGKPDPRYTLMLNENYIRNGEFNNGVADWSARRAQWSTVGNQAPGSAKVTFNSEKGSFGSGAMNQCVNVGENTKFDFGASVKRDEASTQSGGGRIRVSWNEKENCMGRVKADVHWADIDKERKGWQILEARGLIAPSGTQSVHIELIQSIAGPGTYSVFWDDVYFKAVK